VLRLDGFLRGTKPEMPPEALCVAAIRFSCEKPRQGRGFSQDLIHNPYRGRVMIAGTDKALFITAK